MTNGKRIFDELGNHSKAYNIKDGLAIKNISEKGITTMILSGDNSKVTQHIGKRLKFDHVIIGCDEKLKYLPIVDDNRVLIGIAKLN